MRGTLREHIDDISTGFNDGWPLKSRPASVGA
jgi:hypothetical protein